MPAQEPIPIHSPILARWQGLDVPAGLCAVTGDERTGKTHLLRQLAGLVETPSDLAPAPIKPDALWLDLALPGLDDFTPQALCNDLQSRCPQWNAELVRDLATALQLHDHLGKRLLMLSTGSRRKVALAGLLASGATLTCLDQPYAALDMASVRVIRGFLRDMAGHTSRAWLIADYEADPALPWASVIRMD